MADVISFGMAPAALTFAWGLSSLGRLGWAAAFLFVTGAALRLARFNIQTGAADKRFFVGLPSPGRHGAPELPRRLRRRHHRLAVLLDVGQQPHPD